jgi:hypothetical protein
VQENSGEHEAQQEEGEREALAQKILQSVPKAYPADGEQVDFDERAEFLYNGIVCVTYSHCMKKKLKMFERAISLRKSGHSFREIGSELGISPSTASIWVRNVRMSLSAKKRIAKKQEYGRMTGSESLRKHREERESKIRKVVESTLHELLLSKEYCKCSCALLYGCEGSKTERGRVVFVNSDPELIRFFLFLFRTSFSIDESKFRALVHMHGYHNEEKQIQFWSDITKIPMQQFTRSFRKKNGGKNIRVSYQGCVSIRYGSADIQKELIFLYRDLLLRGHRLIG